MNKKRTDYVVSAVILVFAMAVFAMTKKFPKGRVGVPGPNFFPNLVAGSLVVLAIALFVRTYFFTNGEDSKTDSVVIKPSWRLVAFTVLLAIIYSGVMEWLGFIVSTFFFIMSLAYLYKMKTWWKVGLFSLSVTLATYLVFARFLLVQLPMGFFLQ